MAKNIEGSFSFNLKIWYIALILFFWGFEDDGHFGYITKLTNKHCRLCMRVQYFDFSISWCCSSGDDPEEYLAKFGNIQNMKVEKC
jgi:hypothetical protein